MSLDGFLTFLTLITAIYALSNSSTRIKINTHWKIYTIISIFLFIVVLYFEFFSIFGQKCPVIISKICKYITFTKNSEFKPEDAAFIVVIFGMIFTLLIQKILKKHVGSITSVKKLTDTLIYEKKYDDLIQTISPILSKIKTISNENRLLDRIHRKLNPKQTGPIGYILNREKNQKSALSSFIYELIAKKISYFLPTHSKSTEIANDIIGSIFRSEQFCNYIAQNDPYFGLEILKINKYGVHNFSKNYFTSLISNSNSILYQEIQNNQNLSYSSGYDIPEHNRVLSYLFHDANNAKNLSVWGPIGEYLLKNIKNDPRGSYISYLNDKSEFFDEEECWTDPTYIGMHFFDIMVRSAAFQDIKWHMWLYYYPYIVENLCLTFDISKSGANEQDEFPSRSARLIYEAISHLGDWVKIIKYLPPGSPHREISSLTQPDNGNIPVSAATALGSCLCSIVRCESINDQFSRYMHKCIMHDISELRTDTKPESDLRKYLINSIIKGGQRQGDAVYRKKIRQYFYETDHVLCSDLEDYETQLKNI